MKTLINLAILTLTTVPFISDAQINVKEQKRHADKVAKSKEKSKTILSLDTVFASGKPYALMIPTKKGLLGAYEWSVKPLKGGKEVAYIALTTIGQAGTSSSKYVWVFAALNLRAETLISEKPEENLVAYDLLNDSSLNKDHVQRFCSLKGNSISAAPVVPEPIKPPAPKQVERDRTRNILIIGKDVSQDLKTIGTIEKTTVTIDYKMYTQLIIKFMDGTICATALNNELNGHEWTITTASNNTKTTVKATSFADDQKTVLKWLIDSLYL